MQITVKTRYKRLLTRLRGGVLRRLQPLAARGWKNLCHPTCVMHKLTLKCNACCVHCDIWNEKYQESELSTSEIKKLYEQLRKWLGPYNLVMTGGEALLRSDAVELATYASNLGFVVEFLTNGYLLEKAAAGLANSGVDRVTISFDGSCQETVNKIRGKDDFFQRSISGIRRLNDCRRECGADFQIWIKTVVMKHNLTELVAIAHLAAEMGAEVYYQPIEQNYAQTYDASWYKNSNLWIQNMDEISLVIDELVRLKKEGLPIANTESNLLVIPDYFRNPEAWMRKVRDHVAENTSSICLSGVGYFEILPDGGVKNCGEGGEIGNCKTKSPREIWRERPTCWLGGCKVMR